MKWWNGKHTVAAAGIAVIALLVFVSTRRAAPHGAAGGPATLLTAKAVKKPLTITVIASGEVRPKDSNKIIPKIKGQCTISFLTPEGKHVSSNELVATLSPEDADRKIRDLEDKQTQQQSQFDTTSTDLAIQEMDNVTSLKTATQNLENARMELEKFLQADQPLEKRNAELAVQTADGQLGRLQNRHDDLKSLLKEGFITEDEVEEARIAADEARVALDTARIKLANLGKYEHPLKRAQLENALAKAVTELSKTQKNNETVLKNKQRALATATRQLDTVTHDLKDAHDERDALEIKAPGEGVVYYGDVDEPWRRGDIQVGGYTRAGQILMTIPSLLNLKAVVSVSEAEIREVKLGQKATVTCDALAGRTFAGEVTKVAEVPNQQNWWSGRDVKEFTVDIMLKDASDLKPGFSGKAEIVTDEMPPVLQVPIQAGFRDGDKFYVYPVSGPKRARSEVRVGKSSVTQVQILDGVTEGEALYLSKPEAAEGAM